MWEIGKIREYMILIDKRVLHSQQHQSGNANKRDTVHMWGSKKGKGREGKEREGEGRKCEQAGYCGYFPE